MNKKSLPPGKAYTLLESGPVIMVTTAYRGRSNIMTMSWHTMMDFEPALVGFVMSDRNYSFGLLTKSRECAINIPTADIAEKAVACGRIHGGKINKFEKFGLTAKTATLISAPLIEECYASFECRIADTRMVNKYGFFVVEVVKAWINRAIKNPQTLHHLGGNNFMIAGKIIQIKSPK